jgi:hypothetical protein
MLNAHRCSTTRPSCSGHKLRSAMFFNLYLTTCQCADWCAKIWLGKLVSLILISCRT